MHPVIFGGNQAIGNYSIGVSLPMCSRNTVST